MTDELKPVRCGCGGEAILKHYCYSYGDDDQYYYVWCPKCDIQTKTYPTEAEAITAWNKVMGKRDEVSRVGRTAKVTQSPLKEDVVIGHTTFGKGTKVIAHCGCCDTWVRVGDKYCHNCGAKLDWGER